MQNNIDELLRVEADKQSGKADITRRREKVEAYASAERTARLWEKAIKQKIKKGAAAGDVSIRSQSSYWKWADNERVLTGLDSKKLLLKGHYYLQCYSEKLGEILGPSVNTQGGLQDSWYDDDGEYHEGYSGVRASWGYGVGRTLSDGETWRPDPYKHFPSLKEQLFPWLGLIGNLTCISVALFYHFSHIQNLHSVAFTLAALAPPILGVNVIFANKWIWNSSFVAIVVFILTWFLDAKLLFWACHYIIRSG